MKTRIIQTRFWEDDFVANLDVDAKLIFLYLLSNESVGLTGVYEKPIRTISFFTGVSAAKIQKVFEQVADKILYVDGWVVLKNALKYNNYASNEKQRMAYMKEWENLPDRLKPYAPYFDDIAEYKPKYKKGYSTNYQHRDVAQKYLGRQLSPEEVVHHIDEDPSNNEPENLAVMNKELHELLHQGKIGIDDKRIILVSVYSHSTPKSENKNKKTENKNYKSIKDLTNEDFQDIADKYNVRLGFVQSKYEDLVLYCDSKGKTYKNYKSALMNFVKDDAEKHPEKAKKPKPAVANIPEYPEVSEEQRKENIRKMAEMKKQIFKGKIVDEQTT